VIKHRIDTSVDIDASPRAVWQVLTDFPAYPDWNPFIRTIEGQAILGTHLSVMIQPDGQKPMRFRPQVEAAEDAARFSWTGRVLMRGLFDGHHEFELHPHGEGTRLLHREYFSGLLVPLIWKKLEQPTRAGFEAMNRALKARAEAPEVKE
jgi:hypothetical protein